MSASAPKGNDGALPITNQLERGFCAMKKLIAASMLLILVLSIPVGAHWKKPRPGHLGIFVKTSDPNPTWSVRVTGVAMYSAAYHAGIQCGDRIFMYEVGYDNFRPATEFESAKETFEGDIVNVYLVRDWGTKNERLLRVTVPMGPVPAYEPNYTCSVPTPGEGTPPPMVSPAPIYR